MTQIDRTTFKASTTTLYADNTTGDIGAGDLRIQMDNIADSVPFISTGYIAPPTTNDDTSNTAGNGRFGVGDIWVDESNNKAYICVDPSTGNAIWVDMSYIDASALSATAAPEVQEIAVWVNATTLRGFTELKWDNAGSNLNLTGNLLVSGTVDGRDIAVDGAKLDGIPSNAISGITMANNNVNGGNTGFAASTITVATGDGLELIDAGSGNARLEIRNNDIAKNTVARVLSSTDNGSHITNAGAVAPVTWTLPITSALQTTPRLVATFFKVANQTMNIVGASTVTVNGVAETGGNESLIEICPVPYDSFAVVMYAGVTNTYYVYQGTDIKKLNTVANTELAFWTADGTIDGAPEMLWDGTALDVTGEVKSNWAFNPQTGTAYTAALTDRGRIVTMSNAAANVFTIPPNASVALPIGTEIRVLQIGAGATSITAGAAVTLNGVVTGSGALTGQWDEVRLYKVAADTWYATGEIGAVA